MAQNDCSDIPPELRFVLDACGAITSREYEEAITLLANGFNELDKAVERISSGQLIKVLQLLVWVVEGNLESDFGIKLRAAAKRIVLDEDPQCCFCKAKRSEVEGMSAGMMTAPGAFICDDCVRELYRVVSARNT